MPIVPPRLDDRRYGDLVAELVARIPAHTPEWTNASAGDPGRTILELFAWLTDTMLYRANLIPERQRLAFLRLAGIPMRAPTAATGLVSVLFDEEKPADSVALKPLAMVKGTVPFETKGELVVLPVTAQAYSKRPIGDAERAALGETLLAGLEQVYDVPAGKQPAFYVTTPIFPSSVPDDDGFDLIEETIDGTLWIALFAAKGVPVATVRKDLGGGTDGLPRILNAGVAPAIAVPEKLDEYAPRAKIPHVWEISGPDIGGEPAYHELTVVSDTSLGLTRRGVLRLVLPGETSIDAPSNAATDDPAAAALKAGFSDRPPRLDDESSTRVVAWIRLRPKDPTQKNLKLSWVGINAAEIDQRKTVVGRVVAASDASPMQEVALGAGGLGVEEDTFALSVEEPNGYQPWSRVDDLAVLGRDDAGFTLDPEAGTVRFGNGISGRIPGLSARVRVETMRLGGGSAGNLPPGSLKEMTALRIDGQPQTRKLKVVQSLATVGGRDGETVDDAVLRIPSQFRHGNRAVTADDYKRIAAETPGAVIGRVEVMPRFVPQQRRKNVPGAVSVVVLPFKAARRPPNPRPDQPCLEAVYSYLEPRRPLATELYVIGCEYVPLGVGVGLTVREGFGIDTVVNDVREALYRHLWPLAPGSTTGLGWPLGKSVRDRELDVIVAQVPGVDTITGVSLFTTRGGAAPPGFVRVIRKVTPKKVATGAERFLVKGFVLGQPVPRPMAPPIKPQDAGPPAWSRIAPRGDGLVELRLESWQLPELLSVVVDTDGTVPDKLSPLGTADGGVGVPVVPEIC